MKLSRAGLRWPHLRLVVLLLVASAICVLGASACAKHPPVQEVASGGEIVPVARALASTEVAVSASAPAAIGGGPVEKPREVPWEPEPEVGASWTIEPAEGGSLIIRYKGVEIASFHYLFWGPNFSWADAIVKNQRPQGGASTFEIDVDKLGLAIAGKIKKTGPAELTIEYAVMSKQSLAQVTGGGLEFRLNLDAGTPAKGSEPRLLPDDRGFQWPVPTGAISVSFDEALPFVGFERNQKNVVRCFLVGKDIAPGLRKFTMKARLPDGGVVRRSVDERYGVVDRASWYRTSLAWNHWPIDLSFLNEKPAGARGKVKADGERLVFEDGSPIRFWGANVQAYALFHGSKEDIKNQAKRLAGLGYNLVRLHHHDSAWVTPNVFDKQAGTSQKLDDQALDMLDWWAKCLKDEGVYLWLDIHVGRAFTAGDNIEGFAELAKQEGSGKGFNYVNPRIEQLMQEFAQKYVTRVNRYTGVHYTEEPAVMGVLITNENDLTQHFGNSLAPDKGNPVHLKLYEKLAQDFAKKAKLPAAGVARTWEPGPAKIALTEIEHRYDQRAIERLRALGLKALLATTSYWGDSNLYSLPALATGDIIDVHSYGSAEALGRNPHYEANLVAWIGAAQVAGKPLSVSEWNVEYPKRDRFVVPLYVASIAALQGWDAPMIYGYTQTGIAEPEKPDTWSSWNDPAITAMMPAAALLFRQGHVKEAEKTYRLDVSREDLYYAETNPQTSAAIRTLVEQSKLVIGLPDVPELSWDAALSTKGGKVIAENDMTRDFLPPGRNFVLSDTGELKRDWALGVETIDTPQTQAVLGWIGKRKFETRDVSFEVATPKAAVAVSSLDGMPIAHSKKLLLSVVAQVDASEGERLPFLAQPVEGTVSLRGVAPLRMVPLSPLAYPKSPALADEPAPILPARRGAEQVFELKAAMPTHWFLLVP